MNRFCKIFNILFLLIILFNLVYTQQNISQKKKSKTEEQLPLLFINKSINDSIPKLQSRANIDTSFNLIYQSTLEDIIIEKVSEINFSYDINYFITNGRFNIFENNEPILLFENLKGSSFSFSIGYENYLSNDFSYSLGLSYEKYYLYDLTNYNIPIINNNYATTEHKAELNLNYFALQSFLKYEIINNFKILTGFSYGILNKSTYNHIVKLKSDEIIYEGNLKEKKFTDKNLDKALNDFSLLIGFAYRMPFIFSNYGIEINPNYNIRLNKLIKQTDLNLSAFIIKLKVFYLF